MNAIDLPKPKLSPEACRVFYKICAYIRRNSKCRVTKKMPSESLWRNAASDVMDGGWWNSDPEVRELKRKQIIRSVAGSWELTGYGREAVSRRIFVPDYCI